MFCYRKVLVCSTSEAPGFPFYRKIQAGIRREERHTLHTTKRLCGRRSRLSNILWENCQCYPHEKLSWNPAGVKPVHCKPVISAAAHSNGSASQSLSCSRKAWAWVRRWYKSNKRRNAGSTFLGGVRTRKYTHLSIDQTASYSHSSSDCRHRWNPHPNVNTGVPTDSPWQLGPYICIYIYHMYIYIANLLVLGFYLNLTVDQPRWLWNCAGEKKVLTSSDWWVRVIDSRFELMHLPVTPEKTRVTWRPWPWHRPWGNPGTDNSPISVESNKATHTHTVAGSGVTLLVPDPFPQILPSTSSRRSQTPLSPGQDSEAPSVNITIVRARHEQSRPYNRPTICNYDCKRAFKG